MEKNEKKIKKCKKYEEKCDIITLCYQMHGRRLAISDITASTVKNPNCVIRRW